MALLWLAPRDLVLDFRSWSLGQHVPQSVQQGKKAYPFVISPVAEITDTYTHTYVFGVFALHFGNLQISSIDNPWDLVRNEES